MQEKNLNPDSGLKNNQPTNGFSVFEKINTNKNIALILIALTILLIGTTTFFAYKYFQLKQVLNENKETKPEISTISNTPKTENYTLRKKNQKKQPNLHLQTISL